MYMEDQRHSLSVFGETVFEDWTFAQHSSRQSPISVARTSMVRLWQSM
jgi:hypothetical protein